MQLIDFAQRNGDTLLLYCGPEDIGFKISSLPEIPADTIKSLLFIWSNKEDFSIGIIYDIMTQVTIKSERASIAFYGENIEVTRL